MFVLFCCPMGDLNPHVFDWQPAFFANNCLNVLLLPDTMIHFGNVNVGRCKETTLFYPSSRRIVTYLFDRDHVF